MLVVDSLKLMLVIKANLLVAPAKMCQMNLHKNLSIRASRYGPSSNLIKAKYSNRLPQIDSHKGQALVNIILSSHTIN